MTADRGDQDSTLDLPESDSGTGWADEPIPDGRVGRDALLPRQDRSGDRLVGRSTVTRPRPPVDRDDDYYRDYERRRPSRMRRLFRPGRGMAFWVAVVAGTVAILLVVFNLLGFSLPNLFKKQTTDRSGPVLLIRIEDLARLETARGDFSVIIDIEQTRQLIPDWIYGNRTLFEAYGSVNAYVDLTNVTASGAPASAAARPGIVVDSTDPKKVTVTLPAPQLDTPNIDTNASQLIDAQTGLFNRFEKFVDPGSDNGLEMIQIAQQKIAQAAVTSGLLAEAQTHAKTVITDLLQSLGFTTIIINFLPGPS